LGEMFNKLTTLGIKVPDGFAVTSNAYRKFLSENKIEDTLKKLLDSINKETLSNLPNIASQCRQLITEAKLPVAIKKDIIDAQEHIQLLNMVS